MRDVSSENPCRGSRSKFFWCLHCERVEFGVNWQKNKWCCPYQGCDGTAIDAFTWSAESWPRSEHTNYPNNPMIGTVYPLYSFVPENFQD